MKLAGRIAFVTGASSGLGRHLALTLAKAGADVALTARRTDRLGELAQAVEALGRRALALEMDARAPASIRAAVERAEAGLGPIDILLNNAGIAVQKPAAEFTEEDYRDQMGTNLDGAWFCAQAVGKRMIARGKGGKIVNMASMLAQKAVPQLTLYCMSKAAVVQMTRCLALEWARHDIQVNAILPGYIETEMNGPYWASEAGQTFMKKFPRRRVGQPTELDELTLLLSGPGSNFMTGSIILVDDAQSLMGY